MKQEIQISWLKDMAFEAEVNGHKIYLDADEGVGGNNMGPRPKPLMMVSLAGCTGMDVVSILKKMRVDYDALDIKVEGEVTEEHPKRYSKMTIIYNFKGKDLPMDKIEKAVTLSQDRYCGVSAVYREGLKLDYKINLSE